ncbi:unnamed protein product [Amoebophrya sp. A120]|nr:unnamed protein product [Amoebophrya sp. A120]|eukprot:GSA120T00015932001.1
MLRHSLRKAKEKEEKRNKAPNKSTTSSSGRSMRQPEGEANANSMADNAIISAGNANASDRDSDRDQAIKLALSSSFEDDNHDTIQQGTNRATGSVNLYRGTTSVRRTSVDDVISSDVGDNSNFSFSGTSKKSALKRGPRPSINPSRQTKTGIRGSNFIPQTEGSIALISRASGESLMPRGTSTRELPTASTTSVVLLPRDSAAVDSRDSQLTIADQERINELSQRLSRKEKQMEMGRSSKNVQEDNGIEILGKDYNQVEILDRDYGPVEEYNWDNAHLAPDVQQVEQEFMKRISQENGGPAPGRASQLQAGSPVQFQPPSRKSRKSAAPGVILADDNTGFGGAPLQSSAESKSSTLEQKEEDSNRGTRNRTSASIVADTTSSLVRRSSRKSQSALSASNVTTQIISSSDERRQEVAPESKAQRKKKSSSTVAATPTSTADQPPSLQRIKPQRPTEIREKLDPESEFNQQPLVQPQMRPRASKKKRKPSLGDSSGLSDSRETLERLEETKEVNQIALNALDLTDNGMTDQQRARMLRQQVQASVFGNNSFATKSQQQQNQKQQLTGAPVNDVNAIGADSSSSAVLAGADTTTTSPLRARRTKKSISTNANVTGGQAANTSVLPADVVIIAREELERLKRKASVYDKDYNPMQYQRDSTSADGTTRSNAPARLPTQVFQEKQQQVRRGAMAALLNNRNSYNLAADLALPGEDQRFSTASGMNIALSRNSTTATKKQLNLKEGLEPKKSKKRNRYSIQGEYVMTTPRGTTTIGKKSAGREGKNANNLLAADNLQDFTSHNALAAVTSTTDSDNLLNLTEADKSHLHELRELRKNVAANERRFLQTTRELAQSGSFKNLYTTATGGTSGDRLFRGYSKQKSKLLCVDFDNCLANYTTNNESGHGMTATKNVTNLGNSHRIQYIRESLAVLKQEYVIVLLSGNYTEFVTEVLRKNYLLSLFDQICGGDSFPFSMNKGKRMKLLIEEKEQFRVYNLIESILIDDQEHNCIEAEEHGFWAMQANFTELPDTLRMLCVCEAGSVLEFTKRLEEVRYELGSQFGFGIYNANTHGKVVVQTGSNNVQLQDFTRSSLMNYATTGRGGSAVAGGAAATAVVPDEHMSATTLVPIVVDKDEEEQFQYFAKGQDSVLDDNDPSSPKLIPDVVPAVALLSEKAGATIKASDLKNLDEEKYRVLFVPWSLFLNKNMEEKAPIMIDNRSGKQEQRKTADVIGQGGIMLNNNMPTNNQNEFLPEDWQNSPMYKKMIANELFPPNRAAAGDAGMGATNQFQRVNASVGQASVVVDQSEVQLQGDSVRQPDEAGQHVDDPNKPSDPDDAYLIRRNPKNFNKFDQKLHEFKSGNFLDLSGDYNLKNLSAMQLLAKLLQNEEIETLPGSKNKTLDLEKDVFRTVFFEGLDHLSKTLELTSEKNLKKNSTSRDREKGHDSTTKIIRATSGTTSTENNTKHDPRVDHHSARTRARKSAAQRDSSVRSEGNESVASVDEQSLKKVVISTHSSHKRNISATFPEFRPQERHTVEVLSHVDSSSAVDGANLNSLKQPIKAGAVDVNVARKSREVGASAEFTQAHGKLGTMPKKVKPDTVLFPSATTVTNQMVPKAVTRIERESEAKAAAARASALETKDVSAGAATIQSAAERQTVLEPRKTAIERQTAIVTSQPEQSDVKNSITAADTFQANETVFDNKTELDKMAEIAQKYGDNPKKLNKSVSSSGRKSTNIRASAKAKIESRMRKSSKSGRASKSNNKSGSSSTNDQQSSENERRSEGGAAARKSERKTTRATVLPVEAGINNSSSNHAETETATQAAKKGPARSRSQSPPNASFTAARQMFERQLSPGMVSSAPTNFRPEPRPSAATATPKKVVSFQQLSQGELKIQPEVEKKPGQPRDRPSIARAATPAAGKMGALAMMSAIDEEDGPARISTGGAGAKGRVKGEGAAVPGSLKGPRMSSVNKGGKK